MCNEFQLFSFQDYFSIDNFSRCCEAEQEEGGHCDQLDGRPTPREEERGIGILLHERHRTGHPRAAQVPQEVSLNQFS